MPARSLEIITNEGKKVRCMDENDQTLKSMQESARQLGLGLKLDDE